MDYTTQMNAAWQGIASREREQFLQQIPEIFENIRKKSPVIESITNMVTVNDCANIILACGASPTMAEHPDEVEEVQAGCDGLVLNIGILSPESQSAMVKAGRKANQLNHPVVFDPVGAGASQMRNDAVRTLCDRVKFTAIRGNISEMKAVDAGSSNTRGVDASPLDLVTSENLKATIAFAENLANRLQTVIAISGAIDVVADREHAYVIYNGHPMMAKITGTGCMVTHVVDVFCASNPDCPLEATAAAIAAFALSGELAYVKTKKEGAGTASFRTYLIDAMSNMDAQTLLGGIRVEKY